MRISYGDCGGEPFRNRSRRIALVSAGAWTDRGLGADSDDQPSITAGTYQSFFSEPGEAVRSAARCGGGHFQSLQHEIGRAYGVAGRTVVSFFGNPGDD